MSKSDFILEYTQSILSDCPSQITFKHLDCLRALITTYVKGLHPALQDIKTPHFRASLRPLDSFRATMSLG